MGMKWQDEALADGFAALNITDATAARSNPSIELVQRKVDALTQSRTAECVHRGPLCRDLEVREQEALVQLAVVRDRSADPQIVGVARLIGTFPERVAMARLGLMTLLPQVGGLLLLVARRG